MKLWKPIKTLKRVILDLYWRNAMPNAAPPALDKEKLSPANRLFFKTFVKTPAGFIAEPFEIFLVVLGLLDSVSLIFHARQNAGSVLTPYYYGQVGLYAWAFSTLVASVALVWSLATMENKNLLAVRKLEIAGLAWYALAFGYYGYAEVAVGLSLNLGLFDVIVTEAILAFLVGACAIRAIALASPITTLSITRVNRVKQIQEQLREALKEDHELTARQD